MKVFIKDLQVSMEVKNVGIELDVSDNEGHKGDLFITKNSSHLVSGQNSTGKRCSDEVAGVH